MVRVNKLSFSFDGGEKLITGLSFTVERGERLLIKAPSGEGKTTLLRLIAGLLSPEDGSIETDGKIGMVFQSDALFPWQTALENVKNVCDEQTAQYWLKKFGLEDSLLKKPHELSGGMCRRVALARAVGYEPDILLLDEPFKGLDSKRKEEIMAVIKKHFSSRIIIFTTHDAVEEEQFATRVIEI